MYSFLLLSLLSFIETLSLICEQNNLLQVDYNKFKTSVKNIYNLTLSTIIIVTYRRQIV